MASGNPNRGDAPKKFPLQLARGVVVDSLMKELDAHSSPSSEAKKAAFEASKASLPRRLALLTTQIAAVDFGSIETIEHVYQVVQESWMRLLVHPALTWVLLPFLNSSLWLEVLSAILTHPSVGGTPLLSSGILVNAAIVAADQCKAGTPAESILRFPDLLEWWSDQVCSARFRVTETWGIFEGKSPLHSIAEGGMKTLVPTALARGCSPNGDVSWGSNFAPFYFAFKKGSLDACEAMMEHGVDFLRPYELDGWPLALRLFGDGSNHLDFLADLLRKHPEIVSATATEESSVPTNLLGAAIRSQNPAVVDLVLSAGAQPQFSVRWKGDKTVLMPTLAEGLVFANPAVLELLIRKGKVAANWRDKYDDEALACVARALATVAVASFPSNPAFKGSRQRVPAYHPHALTCLDMVLATGFVPSWEANGHNALLRAIYPCPSVESFKGCALEQKHALAILRRFHAAGSEVGLLVPSTFVVPHPALRRFGLQHLAAMSGHTDVLEWWLGEVGTPLELDEINAQGPLSAALQHKQLGSFELLLHKYKAPLAHPDGPMSQQPITPFLRMVAMCKYSDEEAERVFRVLIEREPSIFAMSCFDERSITELEGGPSEAPPEGRTTGFAWNPVYILVHPPKPRTLELLLSRNLPGVAAMANRAVRSNELGRPPHFLTAAQVAASEGAWETLRLLLQYTDARVTDSLGDTLPTVEIMKVWGGRPHGPPRALVAMVEARAKREMKDKASTAALTRAAGTLSNAFEDPSVKETAHQSEKKKAKKKAAKKKAKARKRAAVANAGAGAAPRSDGDGLGSDSDDSSGDDSDAGNGAEEPDDNLVDSSNAPSLDLMLEQMGLKADGANASSGK